MLARYERRIYRGGSLVWAGRYKNLHNLSHWHFECEIIACLTGTTTVMIDNTQYSLEKGMCAFIPSQSLHYIQSDTNTVTLVAFFDRSLTSFATDFYDLVNPVFEDKYDVCSSLLQIKEEARDKKDFYGQISDSILKNMVYSVFRCEPRVKKQKKEISQTIENYKKLLNEIERDFEDMTFEKAASIMNMSPSYFSRFFKNICGMTFSKYLNVIKVDKAIDILIENPKVSSISLMLQSGFSTLRNFNRVFKDVTGYSPRDLPEDYTPTIRTSLEDNSKNFDPTLNNSQLF